MSSTVAPPRTRKRTFNRRRKNSSNRPFQTQIRSQYIYIRGSGRMPIRNGIFLETRDSPGFREGEELEIPIQYCGEAAVVLVSTDRSKFPIQIESSPIRDTAKFAVFAHGILFELKETHRGKKAFRLVSQHKQSCVGLKGRRCPYAKFLHNCGNNSKNGFTKLVLNSKARN